MAVGTNMRFETWMTFLLLAFADMIDALQLVVDVVAGQVGVDLEHVRMHRPPHNHLDHTLRDSLVNQVGNPGVPEEMGCYVPRNPGPLADPVKLDNGPVVCQRPPLFVEKHERISLRNARVIVPPLRNVFLRHDDANIPGLPGLKVHVHDNPGSIEVEIAPFHCCDLSSPEASFIQHSDEGPVNAPPAGREHFGNLLRGEQVGRLLRHVVY